MNGHRLALHLLALVLARRVRMGLGEEDSQRPSRRQSQPSLGRTAASTDDQRRDPAQVGGDERRSGSEWRSPGAERKPAEWQWTEENVSGGVFGYSSELHPFDAGEETFAGKEKTERCIVQATWVDQIIFRSRISNF